MESIALRNTQFEQFYSSYQPILSRTAYMKTGNQDDAEDLCQDLFLHFYNNLGCIKKEKKWLNSVLRNLLVEYYNDNTKAVEVFETYEISDNIKYSYNDSAIDVKIMLKDILENEDVFMDDLDKSIFNRHFVDNLSYCEIASVYDLTERQVQYRIEKQKARIKYSLKLKGIRNLDDLF